MFDSVLATFGIAIILQQLMARAFGGADRIADSGLGSWFFFDGLVGVAKVKVLVFVACIALGAALSLFVARSRQGQAIRATAQEPRAARVLGIETRKVYRLTYALNAAICGAAGGLASMAYTIHPYSGLCYTVRSFMIVVLAGLGNLAGVVWAALGLGIADSFGDRYPALQARRHERARVLSGGERRLLEISRALIMDPEVLLIDEPSIGLDPRAIDMIFATLAELRDARGKTLVIVEQNARKGLEFADVGYVLVAGRLVKAGHGKELLASPDMGRVFLGGD